MLTSLPLGAMFVFSQINFKADGIMLSVLPVPAKYGLNNTESVAVYALPYKIFEVCLVIPTFFLNSVYPLLVIHMQESRERLKRTFTRSILFLFGSGVVVGIFGVLLANLAITLLGGAQFSQSIPVLQILLGGIVLYYLTQPLAWLIVTLGKQIYLPFIYLTSAVFNVTANYLFIPRYSFFASAIITHLSELLILVLLTAFAIRAWKLKYAN
jgi:O-antigen/teichoic acid export membrane protein